MIAFLMFVLAQAPAGEVQKAELPPPVKTEVAPPPKVTTVKKYGDTKPVTPAKDKPVDTKPKMEGPSIDAIIAVRVQDDPDVKIAEAEVLLAQAKLNAVKVAAAQKVAAMQNALNDTRAKADAEATKYRNLKVMLEDRKTAHALLQNAGSSAAEVLTAKQKIDEMTERIIQAEWSLEEAKSQYQHQEQAWKRFAEQASKTHAVSTKTLTPLFTLRDSIGVALESGNLGTSYPASVSLSNVPVREGMPLTFQQILRAALDKPIKVDVSIESDVVSVMDHLMAAAKLSIRIKYPDYANPKLIKNPGKVRLEKGEMSLGAWLALVSDEYSETARTYLAEFKQYEKMRMDFYVRDYGLQLTTQGSAAPGALTLAEFWKQPLPVFRDPLSLPSASPPTTVTTPPAGVPATRPEPPSLPAKP